MTLAGASRTRKTMAASRTRKTMAARQAQKAVVRGRTQKTMAASRTRKTVVARQAQKAVVNRSVPEGRYQHFSDERYLRMAASKYLPATLCSREDA